MLVPGRRRLLVLCTSFVVLSLLTLPSDGSSNSTEDLNQGRNKTGHPLEGYCWSECRASRKAADAAECSSIAMSFLRFVSSLQPGVIAAVLLATGGAALSLMNFENSFSNSHQRVGLALYGFMWLQPIIGFFRPERGVKGRSLWFFFHWLLGIAVCATGIVNVYSGLRTYHERTARSVSLWTGLLTVEISFLAFFYLLIDRWSYMIKQGRLPVEQLRPNDNHRTYPTTLRKELGMVQE
uniref:Uncharacterized protein n=1 Tax=Aegilops tauschii TaxID=37682 RepID=M8D3A6_AEGTA